MDHVHVLEGRIRKTLTLDHIDVTGCVDALKTLDSLILSSLTLKSCPLLMLTLKKVTLIWTLLLKLQLLHLLIQV